MLAKIGEGSYSLFRKYAKKLLWIVTGHVVWGGSMIPATSQKESTPKFCGGSSRHISKRIRSKILWRYCSPAKSQKVKTNPLQNSVEAVPTKSKKESTQNSVEVHSSGRISKRIRPQILCRQFPPNLKKHPPQNYDGSCKNWEKVLSWLPGRSLATFTDFQ